MSINLKAVLVGDHNVGKTCFLLTYATNAFPKDKVPIVTEDYNAKIKYKNKEIALGVWDTAGKEIYDRLRPLSYPQTDVFILVFDLLSQKSFQNIKTRWYPEVSKWVRNKVMVLLGTKNDLIKPEVLNENQVTRHSTVISYYCRGISQNLPNVLIDVIVAYSKYTPSKEVCEKMVKQDQIDLMVKQINAFCYCSISALELNGLQQAMNKVLEACLQNMS